MARPHLFDLSQRLLYLLENNGTMDDADKKIIDDCARALSYAHDEVLYLQGQAKAARESMDMVVRRLTNVTMNLWPGPFKAPDGHLMDGTDAMKIKCHDAARAAATRRDNPMFLHIGG